MSFKLMIDRAEKLFLVLTALFTVVAMGQEVLTLVESRKVEVKDLLLMFIYAEVLGMLGASCSRQRHLAALPLVIAITALSRLIIPQGKETDPVALIYECSAILLIAGAAWIITRMRWEE